MRLFPRWATPCGKISPDKKRSRAIAGTKYLDLLIEDVNQGVKTKNDSFNLSQLTANFKAAAVGANIRVVVQQPTAIVRASAVIAPKYLVQGALKRGDWDTVKKWAPIAQWKDWGYFELDNGRLIKDIILGTDSKIDKLRQLAMSPAGKADSITWTAIWNACELEISDKQKGLKPGSDEYYKAVAERFNEVIDKTQVVDGILQRNQTMRSSSDLTRMATSFMSEPVTSFSMFSAAVYDLRNSTDPKVRQAAKKQLARTSTAIVMADVICAAVASLVDALRDDDKKQTFWQKWAEALFGLSGDEEGFGEKASALLSGSLVDQINPLNKVPFGKDLVSLLQGYSIDRMDVTAISKFIQSGNDMIKALRGEGKYTIGNALAELIANASRVLGLPVANVKQDIAGVLYTTLGVVGNWEVLYRTDKLLYSINSSSNTGRYYDLVFYAWQEEDKAQYEAICADMLKHGFTQEKIDNAIRTRLKKTEEFTAAKSAQHDNLSSALESSKGFSSLSGAEKEKALELVNEYAYVKSLQENDKDYQVPNTYAWIGKAEGGADVGLEPWEYILFQAAYSMIESDKDKDGNSISGSKQEKVIEELRSISDLTNKERDYIFGTLYTSDKNNPFD